MADREINPFATRIKVGIQEYIYIIYLYYIGHGRGMGEGGMGEAAGT